MFDVTKTLVIVRGLPGSGKTTFADYFAWLSVYKSKVFSADDYFMVEGEYKFNPNELHKAHKMCRENTRTAMKHGTPTIFLANTSTTKKEYQPYIDMAEEYGYRVFSIVVENVNGTNSVHNVPEETINKMRDRFTIIL